MRKILGSLAAIMMTAGILIGVAPAAQAADSYAYVVVNDRVCGKNKVRGLLIHDVQSGFTSKTWDRGDNIIYPKVKLRVRNQLNIQVQCYKKVGLFFWQPVGFTTRVAYITPTKHQQTFWVG